MSSPKKFFLGKAVTVTALLTVVHLVATGGLHAMQTATASDTTGAGKATVTTVTKDTATGNKQTLQNVAESLSHTSGAIVLADSSVARQRVPPPAATTTENLESQLDAIVKALPAGATWAKIYLPSTDHPLDADAVTDLVLAQARLFGGVGAAPAGTIEVLGQKVPADQAQAMVATLKLKPVYLITNPTTHVTGATAAANASAENHLSVQEQAQQILSMDPDQMEQYFINQRDVNRALWAIMSVSQRHQYLQLMRSGPVN